MYWDHLKTVSDNRKKAAKKAAKTRQQKAGKISICCTICRDPYIECTEEVERWIQCDICDGWVHFVCAGLQEEPENFVCEHCV